FNSFLIPNSGLYIAAVRQNSQKRFRAKAAAGLFRRTSPLSGQTAGKSRKNTKEIEINSQEFEMISKEFFCCIRLQISHSKVL
ncbi:MAG: hypothetical protein LBF85_05140, partial [Tannerella sp.]|nr:hypothetical protein [Tannerella sp.]